MVYPFRCMPIYKSKRWGGHWFAAGLGRVLPSEEPFGESWELSCRPGDQSVVVEGAWAGKTLAELFAERPLEVFGSRVVEAAKILGQRTHAEGGTAFSLLVKFLDATDNLSVQVHPDDQYASAHKLADPGKTEMWYVLDAEPGAGLIVGLADGVGREELTQAIAEDNVVEQLSRVGVKPGDAFFIPAGTVHAILKGVRLAEIQQNSDTTYRLYDWNWVDSNGQQRELHIAEALEVIDYCNTRVGPSKGVKFSGEGWDCRYLAACPYFAVEEWKVTWRAGWVLPERFEAWMILAGSAKVRTEAGQFALNRGETWFLPAALGEYRIEGDVTILKTYIPDLEKEIIDPLVQWGYGYSDLQKIGGLGTYLECIQNNDSNTNVRKDQN